ncbi:MAG: Arm DNA-binding domain-containing protein [Aerococcus sp.]|nr:Arm DNA-binding domain-containing protein [Aerococcus sp.]
MATYTQYKNTRGTFWRVRGIVGIDEYTGKKSEIKKGGFVTKREAKAYFEKQREEFVSGLARGTQSLTFEAVYQ